MTLWRLELARLVRTRRWVIVLGVFAFFGVVGPLSARYINEIIERFGGGLQFTAPDPTPVDGILQYLGNASQLGVLAVVVVASLALAVDAQPEIAAFLRTKVTRGRELLPSRYVVTTCAAVTGLVVGTLLAWVLTSSLIGGLPAGALLVGMAYGALYMAFAVAVVALVATVTNTQATTIFASLGGLLLFPILGVIDPLEPWLPSTLLTATAPMVQGVGAGEFLRAVVVSLLATAALLALTARRMDRREL